MAAKDLSPSPIKDLEDALGQFMLYRHILRCTQPARVLYLAVRKDVYQSLLGPPEGEALVAAEQIKLIVFDQLTQEIVLWIA